jgi:methanogenic corrinoid protein MtbC1
LLLLKDASRWHHNIAQIAQLPSDDLIQLASANRQDFNPAEKQTQVAPAGPYIQQCLAAIRSLNGAELERLLAHAFIEMGSLGLATEVIGPLMDEVGEAWAEGKIRVAEEHVASVVVRNLLGGLVRQPDPELAPRMIVATPAGQIHELGALAVVIHASSLGWAVQYLGSNLPAEEIALAAQRKGPKVVALSIAYKNDEATLTQELQRLRLLLEKNTVLLVGGPAASAYQTLLKQIAALYVSDLWHLKNELEKL